MRSLPYHSSCPYCAARIILDLTIPNLIWTDLDLQVESSLAFGYASKSLVMLRSMNSKISC